MNYEALVSDFAALKGISKNAAANIILQVVADFEENIKKTRKKISVVTDRAAMSFEEEVSAAVDSIIR